MASTSKLLDRSEVEARFGIPKRYLEMAGMRGDGPAFVRIGRRVRYLAADIEAWLQQNRVEPSGF